VCSSSDGFADTRQKGTASSPPVVVDRIIYAGWILATVGGGALLAVHLANVFTIRHRLLDANGEGTVWTWASVVAAFAVAFGAGLRFVAVPTERGRYGVLALVAAFLSLDDLVVLHEGLAGLAVKLFGLSDTWDSVLWPALYAPLLGSVVLVLERVTRRSPTGIRRQALVGIALLGAAVALEVVSAPWSTGSNLIHAVEGGFEEAAEQAGWTLLASAIVAIALTDLIAESAAASLGRRHH
jgi:hypothetical protein